MGPLVPRLDDPSTGYTETRLPVDASSRQSGFEWLSMKAYNMSLVANEQVASKEEKNVADDIQVKLHLGQDDNGICIRAIACHLQFTVDANFQNVAKTWWFDLVESTPLVSSAIVERLGDHIVYVKHEHTTWKYKRLCVAGVFLDNKNDRITITQTGIALDDRFPFIEDESRTNGFQWIVFQHVTDHLTIVRWSILNFCPVNRKGPMSLRDMARNMRCSVSAKDSEETLLAKIHSASENVLEDLRNQFLRRCSRFKLEAPTLGSRDFSIDDLCPANLGHVTIPQ